MFDNIVHTTDDGVEYWLARELQPLLGYSKWDNFENVIDKAKESCQTACIDVLDHFADVGRVLIKLKES